MIGWERFAIRLKKEILKEILKLLNSLAKEVLELFILFNILNQKNTSL